MNSTHSFVARIYHRNKSDQRFVAFYLQQYLEQYQLEESELMQELKLQPDNLPLLGNCIAPAYASPEFVERTHRIAAFAGAAPGPLVRVLKSYHILEQFRHRSGDPQFDSGLRAARNKEEE